MMSSRIANLNQLYGNLERVCKWIKIFLLVAVFILMIVVNLGGRPLQIYSIHCT